MKDLDSVLEDLFEQFVQRIALREKIRDKISAQLVADEAMKKSLSKTFLKVRAIEAFFVCEKVLDRVEIFEDVVGKAEGGDGKNLKQSGDSTSDKGHTRADSKNADEDQTSGASCDGEDSVRSGQDGKSDADS